ncbi:MAG: hypothetical protein FJX75_26925 [Armatimonadetes bacterium]|nr:hypothetical protein [Armatimonadota bacterium]
MATAALRKGKKVDGPPEGLSDEQMAEWLESEAGLAYLLQAEWKPARFVPAHPEFIPVTIRLPAELRDRMRRLASDRSMGYQTLARQWLLERCAKEEAKERRQAAKRKPAKPRRKKPVPMNHAAG